MSSKIEELIKKHEFVNINCFPSEDKLYHIDYKAFARELVDLAFDAGANDGQERTLQDLGKKSIHNTEYPDKEQFINSLFKDGESVDA